MLMSKGSIFMLALLCVSLVACGEDGPESAPEQTEQGGFDPELQTNDDLSEAKQLNAKADEPYACGPDVCSSLLCGYDCGTSGQQCQRSCAASDARQDTFIRLQVSGSESASVDSTSLPYEPILSLSNVVFYGCELWDYSNQEYDGLEIKYRDIRKGAFLVGDPSEYGVEANIYIEPFEGPGSYIAEGFVSINSERRKQRDYYYQKQSCGVSVDVDDAGMVTGEIFCEQVAHKSDSRKIKVTGSFGCGKNSIKLPIIVKRPS